jgi:hypothetical protein
VGQGDHRPVLQHRADRGRVDLALGDEDALTPRLEPVTTEQEVLRLPVDTTLAVLVPVLLERDGPVDRVPILRDLGDQRAPRVGGLRAGSRRGREAFSIIGAPSCSTSLHRRSHLWQ